jgi:hypothetical protein
LISDVSQHYRHYPARQAGFIVAARYTLIS